MTQPLRLTKQLALAGCTVRACVVAGGRSLLDVTFEDTTSGCPKCGITGQLYKHGMKPTRYLDVPWRGLPAKLCVNVQRYKCRACGETFQQALAGMHPVHRMTQRCAELLRQHCQQASFSSAARLVGCDERTVRSLVTGNLENGNQPTLSAQLK